MGRPRAASSGRRRSISREWGASLAKPMPGSMAMASRADPGLFGRSNAGGELGGHLAGDVSIDGPGVHRGGIAAHVHQNDGAAARRDERGGGGVVGQR